MTAPKLQVLLLLICTALPAIANQPPIDVIIYDRPPLYDLDTPSPSGLVVTPTAAIFEEAGVAYRWRIVSAKAALHDIQRNQNPACAPGWYRTPEREGYAKYTLPFFQDAGRVVLYRADDRQTARHKSYRSLMEDRSLTLGLKSAYSYGKYVDELIETLAPRSVITSQDGPGMVRMLLGGRFDYFFLNTENATHVIQQSPRRSELATFTPTDVQPGNLRHILCTMKTDDAIIERLNRAIRSLQMPQDPRERAQQQP
jgi:uncharacterized protein (TIGR02285 family)